MKLRQKGTVQKTMRKHQATNVDYVEIKFTAGFMDISDSEYVTTTAIIPIQNDRIQSLANGYSGDTAKRNLNTDFLVNQIQDIVDNISIAFLGYDNVLSIESIIVKANEAHEDIIITKIE